MIELEVIRRLGVGDVIHFDISQTFVDMFMEQVNKTPIAIAIVDNDSSITYRELEEQSNAFAHWLVEEQQVIANDFVAVMMPRVKEFVVAVLGIWKAGAAYVPIDLEYPEERKIFIVDDCEAKVVVSPDNWPILDLYNSDAINLSTPSGLAYMIYTSGSTGKPKGVMIGHDGLLNYVHSTVSINGIQATDYVSAFRSFSFDSHIEEFYPSLAAGATVYIMPESIRKDISAIEEFIHHNSITVAYFTTSLATLLYKSCSLPVRFIGAVGEKLNGVVSGKNGVRILNTYGPTECTDHISTYWLEDGRKYDNIPIGRPLPNGVVFIVDEDLNLVPKGEIGELCFSSVQLARGYWKQPELTAEKFVDCQYVPGAKMYRTGDLCRWNDENQLEYIGRKDNQVKLHGYRIELGEIESVAAQYDGVTQVAAIVKNGAIVLYWCGIAKQEALKDYLKGNLAEFMLPSFYVYLDSMPLNGNGKIDRKALPDVCQQINYVAPKNNREAVLCYYLSSILKVDRIGVTDSFKSYGMDSLTAMSTTFFLNKKGIRVSMSDIIESDTVRNLAKAIENRINSCGYWYDGYDDTKETIVWSLGVIAAYSVNDNIKLLADKFNVYMLETMYIAWPDLNPMSYADIIEAYYSQMLKDIPCIDRISAFVGFSIGGCIAYCLACKYDKQFGSKPLILIGDSTLHFSSKKDVKPMDPTYHPDLALTLKYLYESVDHLGALPLQKYDGKVILLVAQLSDITDVDVSKEWKSLACTIENVYINDNHNGLYTKEVHYDLYRRLLLKH